MEAESEEGDFHENAGRQKLDDEVALSKRHKGEACNVDMMRERAVEGAGAGAAQPCLIHSHPLMIKVDLVQQQPDGQRLQLGRKKQGSRGQMQMLHENCHFHDF